MKPKALSSLVVSHLLLTLAAGGLAACGGDDSSGGKGPDPSRAMTCIAEQMKLWGKVEGIDVTFTHPWGGGFSDIGNGGGLITQQSMPGSRFHDPAIFDLRADWQGSLNNSFKLPVEGRVILPTSAPGGLGGKEYCLGAGSTAELVSMRPGLVFVMSGLRTDGCKTPVAGTLYACWEARD